MRRSRARFIIRRRKAFRQRFSRPVANRVNGDPPTRPGAAMPHSLEPGRSAT